MCGLESLECSGGLCQCAELERSFFPSCFSVLLRPVRQITCAAFDAGETEAVWSTSTPSPTGYYAQLYMQEPRWSNTEMINY